MQGLRHKKAYLDFFYETSLKKRLKTSLYSIFYEPFRLKNYFILFTVNSNDVSNKDMISKFFDSYSDWENFFWSHTTFDEEYPVVIISGEGERAEFDLFVRHDQKDVIVLIILRHTISTFNSSEYFSSEMLYDWITTYEKEPPLSEK